jgi:UDP-2-acetamido-3-amino-2,3-dideoxy-glucuronate N-acetyltransferase
MTRKVCVIGAGKWGKNHIKTLNSMGALAGIAETRENVRSEFGALYPGVQMHPDYRETIGEGYDGYVVATPAETHFEVASFLLKNRKHVLVEKPMALSSAEARTLQSLAAENKVNLMVGHVLLFHPAIRRSRS